MDDPRLNSAHLLPPRRNQYGAARAEILDALGSITHAVDRLVLSHRVQRAPFAVAVRYFLRDLRTGGVHPLRVGITAIGRAPENDIILEENWISRRHCVIVVHADGGCEIRDTASRNGTRVNRREVSRSELSPGDCVQLCDDKFVVLGDEPEEVEEEATVEREAATTD